MSGWNKPTGKPVETKKAAKPAFKHVLIASGVVAVLGCVLLLVFGGGDGAPKAKAEKKAGVIKEAAAVPRAVTGNVESAESAVAKKEEREVIRATTNKDGVVMQTLRYPDGRTVLKRVPPPPVFANKCDQAIVMALSSRNGGPIPPLPPMSDRDIDKAFQESMLSPISISSEDSERVAALKAMVKSVRTEILEMIKGGDQRSVAQILRDHVRDSNNRLELKVSARQELEKVYVSEGEDFARAFLEKVNAHLEKCGVEPISGLPNENPAGAEHQRGRERQGEETK